METSLFNRVQATLLALATVALFLLAVLNFRQERAYQQPDDGVWWHEVAGGLQAERVLPHMPGQLAGLQANDLLTAVNDTPVKHISDLERAFYRAGGPYGQVYYTITRDGIPLDTPVKVIPVPVDRSLAMGLRVIGLFLGEGEEELAKMQRLFPRLIATTPDRLPEKLGGMLISLA